MGDKLKFTNGEAEWLEKIAKYYEVTKELLIFGEQVDPDNLTLTQSINELRNCLDHLIRVISFKFDPNRVDSDDRYVQTNLDKSYGHVYRAAYDTLDWVSLTLKDRIVAELSGFSAETIQAVFPEYYTTIRPRLEEILSEEVMKLRVQKDVAATSEENLVKYGQVTAELQRLFKTIINRKSALVEHKMRSKRSSRIRWAWMIASHIAVGLLVGILVTVLS